MEIGTGNRLWPGPACVMNALTRATFAAHTAFRTGKGFASLGAFANLPADRGCEIVISKGIVPLWEPSALISGCCLCCPFGRGSQFDASQPSPDLWTGVVHERRVSRSYMTHARSARRGDQQGELFCLFARHNREWHRDENGGGKDGLRMNVEKFQKRRRANATSYIWEYQAVHGKQTDG